MHVRFYIRGCKTEYAPLKPKKRDTKENMMDAIFMAKKKRYVKDSVTSHPLVDAHHRIDHVVF